MARRVGTPDASPARPRGSVSDPTARQRLLEEAVTAWGPLARHRKSVSRFWEQIRNRTSLKGRQICKLVWGANPRGVIVKELRRVLKWVNWSGCSNGSQQR